MKLGFAIFCIIITSAAADYLDDYFNTIVSNVNEKLIDYGISNLKVNDLTLAVNRTLIPGWHLEGNVSYTNGVVADLADLYSIVDGHRGGVDENGAHLFYQINFPNMTFFSDVEGKMKDLGSEKGTAELFFANTTVAFYMDFDYNTGVKDVAIETYSTQGPSTNFQPDTDLMNALARLARLEMGYRFLWDQMDAWCKDVFLKMIKDAVNEVEFPIVPPKF